MKTQSPSTHSCRAATRWASCCSQCTLRMPTSSSGSPMVRRPASDFVSPRSGLVWRRSGHRLGVLARGANPRARSEAENVCGGSPTGRGPYRRLPSGDPSASPCRRPSARHHRPPRPIGVIHARRQDGPDFFAERERFHRLLPDARRAGKRGDVAGDVAPANGLAQSGANRTVHLVCCRGLRALAEHLALAPRGARAQGD